MTRSRRNGDTGANKKTTIPILLAVAAATWLLSPAANACCSTYDPAAPCYRTVNVTLTNPSTVTLPSGFMDLDIKTIVTVDSGQRPEVSCDQRTSNPVFCPPEDMPMLAGGVVIAEIDCGDDGEFVGFASLPYIPAAGMHSENIDVPITITGLGASVCDLKVTVNAVFSPLDQDLELVATAETTLCIAEEVSPGVPRLGMDFANAEPPKCGSGMQRMLEIVMANNDPSESVTFMFSATDKQQAVLPITVGAGQGASSISNPDGGDAFPLCFEEDLPDSGVLPLPTHPIGYEQPEISKEITLLAGASQTVRVANVSHPHCGDGSCILADFKAQGTFELGDPVAACTTGSLNLERASDCPDASFEAACCMNSGTTCSDMKPFDCVAAGGVPGDAYSSCQGDVSLVNGFDDACEPDPEDNTFTPVACCFQDFRPCGDEQPTECVEQGGTPYLPVGNTCASTGCPSDWGYCCVPDFALQQVGCQLQLEAMCNSVTSGEFGPRIGLDAAADTIRWGPSRGTCNGGDNDGKGCFGDVDCPAPGFCEGGDLAESFNVYRGDLNLLRSSGDYGSCLGQVSNDPPANTPSFLDSTTPATPGDGLFYLVGFVSPTSVETGLGRDSATNPRTPIACP